MNNNEIAVFILIDNIITNGDSSLSMLNINELPFLEWQIKYVKQQGFKFIVFLTKQNNYNNIISYFGNGENYDININYEKIPLNKNNNILQKYPHKYFILLNGNIFFDINLNWFFDYFKQNSNNKNTVYTALKYKKDTTKYGKNIIINDNYKIIGVLPKNSENSTEIDNEGYILGGIYLGYANIETLLFLSNNNILLDNLFGIPFGDKFIDISIDEDYNNASNVIYKCFTSKKSSALFLDRDGILIKDTGYVSKIEDVIFIEESIELIKEANNNNIDIYVITNQSGIGRGYFDTTTVVKINNYIYEYFYKKGAFIKKFYYCPYYKYSTINKYKKDSLLRKPNPGMILQAIDDNFINPINSTMIGDKKTDIIKLPYIKTYLTFF